SVHDSMMDEVTPEWTAGTARCRILGDAELGSEHPAVYRFGGACRVYREHEHRQIEPDCGIESTKRGRVTERPVDGLPIAKRHEEKGHTTRNLLHREGRRQISSLEAKRGRHRSPVFHDPSERWRRLCHPRKAERASLPLEIHWHRSDVETENKSRRRAPEKHV